MAGYRVTCPYCETRLLGATKDGVFKEFRDAGITLLGHWRFTCDQVPTLKRHERDAIKDASIECVETA